MFTITMIVMFYQRFYDIYITDHNTAGLTSRFGN